MSLKKTKIVATISGKNCSPEFIRSLFDAGMDVVRINTAHQDIADAGTMLENIRKVSDRIAILVDTKGPEIRTTATEKGTGFEVKTGDKIKVYGDPNKLSSAAALYVNYTGFVEEMPKGAAILIDDGDISLKVTEKTDDYLLCEVCDAGIIGNRKSVNVPNVQFQLPAVSSKDREYIHWAIDNDLDFIAHSFVRSKEDLLQVQQILDERNSHLKIIAKIENQQGVDHIDEILNHSYGIMVARGDLGVEIPAEEIPRIQRQLVEKCHRRKKPVIVATQMLHSMIEHPRPTRAEVTDVANAVYQRADAIMLSGETAMGSYPVEAVQVMCKIAEEEEKDQHPLLDIHLLHVTKPVVYTLSKMLVEASINLPIKALACDTTSGRTARYLSAYRPTVPIFAKCYEKHVMRELALSYGVYSSFIAPRNSDEDVATVVVKSLYDNGDLKEEDLVGIMAGRFNNLRDGASFAEINEVGQLLASS